jgi:hypothetical protein
MQIFITPAPERYEKAAIMRAFDNIRRALTFAVSTEEAVSSVLLEAPDGTVYKVEVDNSGNLTTTVVPLGSR